MFFRKRNRRLSYTSRSALTGSSYSSPNDSSLKSSAISPFMAVCFNILILFAIYTICRVEFLLVNYSYFSQAIADGRIWRLLLAGTVFDTPGIFYLNVIWILLMLLPAHRKELHRSYQRINGYYLFCKWLFVIVNTIGIIANLADSVYFSFTMRRTTADVAAEFSNETNILKIFGNEIVNHWYLVILAILMIWAICKLYFSPRIDIRRQSLPRYYLLSTLFLIIAAVIVVSGIRGGFLNHWWQYLIAIPLAYISYRLLRDNFGKSNAARIGAAITGLGAIALVATAPIGGWRHRDIRPIALSNASAWTTHPTETALILNTPFSIIRSIGNSPFVNPGYFADNESEKIFSPLHTPTSLQISMADSLKTRRKNIVVIIIESFGREYIGGFNKELLGAGYKGYTPFTDSLMQHSVTFTNSFANGRKSIDAMPSILSGIPMFVKPFILTPQALNKIPGIPTLLKEQGYTSAFFHGARTGSMGFDGFAKSIGFDSYFGREDFDRDTHDNGESFDGYWAIWDEPFMQYYAEKMTELKQPFMTALFTASSHHPFRVPEKYAAKYPEEGLPIHKCIRYTDNSLREFFATARKQPWFNNTVFIITSDHTNQSDHAEYKSDIGGFSAPLIIYDPSGNIPAGRRNQVAQQTDILPMVMTLTGRKTPYLAYGCDPLTSEADTWAVNYLNGTYQYVRYGYVMQFDGKKVTALYRLGDYKMSHNLLPQAGKNNLNATVGKMENELKAIIQSYMERMTENRLTVENADKNPKK